MIQLSRIAGTIGLEAPNIFACLPAGSSRNHYRFLWPNPEDDINVFELPPARDFLPDIDSSLKEIADLIISKADPSASVLLFGHSLGGSLALATAAYLDQLHGAASQLVLSSVPSPQRGLLNSHEASRLIKDSVSSFIPEEVDIPVKFLEIIENLVEDDFTAGIKLSKVGFDSTDKVVGFIYGNEDPLCGRKDAEWWSKVSPSVKLRMFEGNHFGYMDPQIAGVYRKFIASFANS